MTHDVTDCTGSALGMLDPSNGDTVAVWLKDEREAGLYAAAYALMMGAQIPPWMLATGEDYRYRETVGGSPGVATRFMHGYMDRVVQLATRSVPVMSPRAPAMRRLVRAIECVPRCSGGAGQSKKVTSVPGLASPSA